MTDTMMTHSISSRTLANASRFSHNSIQGHYHSNFEIAYWADSNMLRWSMSVGCLLDPASPAARYVARVVHKRPILGCGVLLGPKDNFLVISDMHVPYHHPDAMKFLAAVAAKYECTRILNVGDLIDHHRGSYHESEADSWDPESEYSKARDAVRELQEMFPKMVITIGNHDRIPVRKLQTVGLPTSMLADYNKVYGLKNTWTWTDIYNFNSHGAQPRLVPMVLTKGGRWNGRIH